MAERGPAWTRLARPCSAQPPSRPLGLLTRAYGRLGLNTQAKKDAMESELIRVNILSIAASGLVLLLAGLALYVLRDSLAKYLRYFLPVPPIAVAAYVYVFNMFRFYNASLPSGPLATLRELFYGTLVATVAFGLFSAAMMLIIYFLRAAL